MKLVASDFDNTLAKNGWVTEENRQAVAAYRRAGGLFGVVTGRSYYISHGIPADAGGLDFMICCTGALIFDGEGKVLYHETAPCDGMVRDVILKAQELGANYFGVNYLRELYAPKMDEPLTVDFGTVTSFDHCNVRFPTPEIADQFVEYIERTYPGRWRGFRNGICVDMPPYGCSKVDGIRRVAQLLGNGDVLVVGDNVNDIPMLRAFPSCCVEAGVPLAKEAADSVTPSVAAMLAALLEQEQ